MLSEQSDDWLSITYVTALSDQFPPRFVDLPTEPGGDMPSHRLCGAGEPCSHLPTLVHDIQAEFWTEESGAGRVLAPDIVLASPVGFFSTGLILDPSFNNLTLTIRAAATPLHWRLHQFVCLWLLSNLIILAPILTGLFNAARSIPSMQQYADAARKALGPKARLFFVDELAQYPRDGQYDSSQQTWMEGEFAAKGWELLPMDGAAMLIVDAMHSAAREATSAELLQGKQQAAWQW